MARPSADVHLARRAVVLALGLALVLAACGGDTAKKDSKESTPTAPALDSKWKLGLVTNVGGTIGDGGFSESAHLGAQRAAQAFNLDYTYAESKDENDYYIQLEKASIR